MPAAAILGTIGTTPLPINIDKLLTSRLLLQAMSGAGKSWALRRLLEQTYGQCQQLIIDYEGEFASLREQFDYVLAARSGGDVATDIRSAKLLAEKLLELRVSAIIDVYELKASERIVFVRRFLEALINAPKALWHPVLVVIDEAHVFCPQTGEAESADAVIDLCARGRKRGFCAVLATQRLSKLHKDAAAECSNKLIGRSTLDVDMKRAADELGFRTKDEQLALRTLQDGEFFAYGPALTPMVQRVIVGRVVTTHPKAGTRTALVAPAPSDKIKAVLGKLADLPAEAEARERSLSDLQRENSALKGQLTKLAKAQPAPAAPKADPQQAAMVKTLQGQVATLLRALQAYRKRAQGVSASLSRIVESLGADEADAPLPALPVPADAKLLIQPPRAAEPRPRGEVRSDLLLAVPNGEPLSGPEQKILNALAWMEDIGVDEPEQPAVAFLAGYTYGAGGFNNPKGRLRSRGFIQYLPNDRMQLTDEGRKYARFEDTTLTTEALHGKVLSRLPGPEQRILKPLLEVYPGTLSAEDLAERANYAHGTGGFNNPKGRLRTLGLIEYPSPGVIKARSILFLPDHQ